MRETGQNGEFGHGPSRTIQTGVFPAAPEQSEKLYDVGGAGSIGVGEYEHRGASIAATSFDQS